MLSRAFYIVFPLMVVFAIFALSASADETGMGDKTQRSYREALEKQNVEDIASPDIPPAEVEPDHPQQNSTAKQDTQRKAENYTRATLKAVITPDKLEKGVEVKAKLTLRDAGGQAVPLAKLDERHTQKVHLLIIDESLTDYHHIHPTEGTEPGTYEFSFTPLTGYSYIVYADVKPAGADPQMVSFMMPGAEKCEDACVDEALLDRAAFGGNTAYLSFSTKKLKAGSAVRGDLFLSGPDNMPLRNLEPIMGAYAHIVGFHEGFGAVTHIHPLGREPQGPEELGASPLAFMLHADNPGFVKLFAQVKIDGQDIILPFSVFIEP